jgi:hypothetical protein
MSTIRSVSIGLLALSAAVTVADTLPLVEEVEQTLMRVGRNCQQRLLAEHKRPSAVSDRSIGGVSRLRDS